MKHLFAKVTVLVMALAITACVAPSGPSLSMTPQARMDATTLDRALRTALAGQDITSLDPGLTPDPAKVALGQALFFDKALSGNRDTSCATCHQPTLGTGDELPLAVGTGGHGMAPERIRGAMRMMVPRNATELFNRGTAESARPFWDGRLRTAEDGSIIQPVEFEQRLPAGLDNILAAQAMFPVTSPAEIRGDPKDFDLYGQLNEVGSTGEYDLQAVWHALMARLRAIPQYVELFQAAYPDTPVEELGFQHAANALAAFQIDAFTLLDSPWDRYLAGDDAALSDEAKQGALLFYGAAGCAECHSGNLLTDQEFHNIAVPQFGPGKGRKNAYIDLGHARETQNPDDRFAFRTPPLRNVALTGPWMHNGAYTTLEEAVRHHLDAQQWCEQYDYSQLPADIRSDLVIKTAAMAEMVERIDPAVAAPLTLTDSEISPDHGFHAGVDRPGRGRSQPRDPRGGAQWAAGSRRCAGANGLPARQPGGRHRCQTHAGLSDHRPGLGRLRPRRLAGPLRHRQRGAKHPLPQQRRRHVQHFVPQRASGAAGTLQRRRKLGRHRQRRLARPAGAGP